MQRLVDGVPKFVGLSMVSVAPFLLYQAWAYTQFCPTEGLRRPWCDEGLGSSYGWVQREYWYVPTPISTDKI
jgi:phosphatidylinositol glycan class V